jgi:ABC-type sugar transport system substrate-binding protein
MKFIPTLTAILIACLMPSSAMARDPYDADWEGDCRPDVACMIQIRPAGKRSFRLTYVAIMRGSGKELCRATGILRRSKDIPGALSGSFGPGQRQQIDVIRASKRDAIHVTPSDNAPCGSPLAVGGIYDLRAH